MACSEESVWEKLWAKADAFRFKVAGIVSIVAGVFLLNEFTFTLVFCGLFMLGYGLYLSSEIKDKEKKGPK